MHTYAFEYSVIIALVFDSRPKVPIMHWKFCRLSRLLHTAVLWFAPNQKTDERVLNYYTKNIHNIIIFFIRMYPHILLLFLPSSNALLFLVTVIAFNKASLTINPAPTQYGFSRTKVLVVPIIHFVTYFNLNL